MAYVTQVNKDEDLISTKDIKKQKLQLFSDLTVETVKLHDLGDLADIELELYKGKAFDALTNVHTIISHELQLKIIKLKDSHNIAVNTYIGVIMINAANYRYHTVYCYKIAHIAIRVLGLLCGF